MHQSDGARVARAVDSPQPTFSIRVLLATWEPSMATQSRAEPGHNVLRALRSAESGWWRRVATDAALAGILGAGVAAVAIWGAAMRRGEPGPLGLRPDAVLAVAAGAMFAAVSWLVVCALRRPSQLDLARRIDVLLEQSERFTTVYEVLAAGGPRGVVATALVDEVGRKAATLDAKVAGWARGARWPQVAAVAAVVVGALALSLPVPGGAKEVVSPAAIRSEVVMPDADALAGLAEVLSLIGEQEDSDYLQALSTSFRELADRVSAGVVSAAEADKVARELAGHLMTASQEVGGAFEAAIEAALAGALNVGSPAATPSERGAAPQSGSQAGPSEPAQAPVSLPPDRSASFYRSLTALVEEFERDPTGLGLRPQQQEQAGAAGGGFYAGVLEASTDARSAGPQQPAAGRSEGPAGGDPAGAAERSSAGVGDAAGQGAAELGAGSDTFLDLAGGGEVVPLAQADSDEGRFVEMELIPLTDPGAAQSTSSVGTPPAFTRSDEAAFTSRGVAVEHAGVVGRYFTPGKVPDGGRP